MATSSLPGPGRYVRPLVVVKPTIRTASPTTTLARAGALHLEDGAFDVVELAQVGTWF